MRRKFWVIVVAIPVILVMVDVAYWRIAVERLRSGFQDWLSSRTASGWQVSAGPISAGGWPQAATLQVAGLTLRHGGPSTPGNLDISADGLALSVSLFNPGTLHLLLTGPAHVRTPDTGDIVVTGEEISASSGLRQSGPLSVELHARRLQAQPVRGDWQLKAGLLDAEAEMADDPTQPAATFTVSSEAIVLPQSIKWPLGANISSLSMNGRLNGPNPAAPTVTRWAEEWRDGGGSLEVTHIAVGWGPLGLTASATLALDEQLQPMGSGNGRVVNYAEALDRLAVGGALTKSAATAAKAVLSLMAGTTGPDEPSSVDVPLTLQYRTLSMRQVPLVRLPELDWPVR